MTESQIISLLHLNTMQDLIYKTANDIEKISRVERGLFIANLRENLVQILKVGFELKNEPIAWKSKTDFYKSFITNTEYNSTLEGYKKYYEPYQCNNCKHPEETVNIYDGRRLAIYETALRDILNPIAAMQRDLPKNCSIDGHAAIRAADNPQHYKDIAMKAIVKADELKLKELEK